MRFKKSLAFILSAVIMCSAVSTSAFAEEKSQIVVDEISPAYEIAYTASSTLHISSNTAECKSTCDGKNDVIQISVEQTLQQFWGLWIWNDVDGASWSTTKSGSSISVVNNKSGSFSGTYRLKSVFTLTDKNGKTGNYYGLQRRKNGGIIYPK